METISAGRKNGAHLKKVKRKVAAADLLLDEGRTGLVDEEHGVGNASDGFIGRLLVVLVRAREGEEGREVGGGGDDLGACGVLA